MNLQPTPIKNDIARGNRHFGPVVAALVLGFVSMHPAAGLLFSTKGNETLAAANYTDWPGLIEAINDPSRVYQVWVNGNESFSYRGNTAGLNRVLKRFALTEVPRLQVILLPGPGPSVELEDGETAFSDWSIQIVGGIARASILERGLDVVWDLDPTLTIYLTDRLDLAALVIPKNVTLLDREARRQRYLAAEKLDDEGVRLEAGRFLDQLEKSAVNEGPASVIFKQRLEAIDAYLERWRKNAAAAKKS